MATARLELRAVSRWWLLSTAGSAIYELYFNSTVVHPENGDNIVQFENVELDVDENDIAKAIKQSTTNIEGNLNHFDRQTSELPSEQFESILHYIKANLNNAENVKVDTERVAQDVVKSPLFQTIFNQYQTDYDKNMNLIMEQNKVIVGLQQEINKIKLDMSEANKYNRDDLMRKYEHLSYKLRQCCRRSIINIEGYVQKILRNLMNDPEFLKNQDGFVTFMNSIFVAKHVLESDLGNLTLSLETKYDDLIEENSKIIMDGVEKKIRQVSVELVAKQATSNQEATKISNVAELSEAQIKKIVKNVLAVYDADKTGLVDYAMETMGGQILTTRCTENYHYGKAVVSVLGIPLWYPVNSPRTVITPSIHPGECWAFQNFPGFVVIQLSNFVEIEAFSLEHISKLLVPDGKIDSAPKEFEVYGLTLENDKEPTKLGHYVYDYDGEPLQFFEVQTRGKVFGIIELRIISNHGNPNYTCLYRFRVHGKLAKENS